MPPTPEWSEPHPPRTLDVGDPLALNVPAVLDAQAARHGRRTCLTVAGADRSFAELRTAAARTAAALAARGVSRGDRVAVLCRTRVEFVEVILGCLWLGAVLVPVNTAWRGRQVAHALGESDPVCVVLDAEYLDVLAETARPASTAAVLLADGPAAPSDRLWGLPLQVLAPGEAELPLREVPPGELAAVLYTSGTTGLSKGVMCPAAQLYWWTHVMRETLRVGPDSVLYSTLPLFHVNAMVTVFLAITTGSRLVLDARFSASRYWERAATTGATHVALLGAMAGMLLAQPPAAADRAHRVTTAFAPDIPAELWPRFVERYGVEEIVAAYAGTETNQVISATGGRRSRPGYMGWIVDGFEARVVDEFDADVPDGTPGELVLRSNLPFAFCLGYLDRPEETLAAMRNLWWHTGDRVVREPDGGFRFVDRLKDMIRRRGENISTWEVEEALLTHPGIAEAAVFGVPSPLGDEDVAAVVVPVPGRRLSGPEIVEHLTGRIAYFAVPRYVEVRAELPHTENGKVSKAPLRALGVTPAMWDRGETGARQPAGGA